MNICQTCQKESKKKFCSLECYYVYRRSIQYECICENCGKSFIVKNGAYIRLQRMKHCSQQCKNRKHSCNEDYFKGELTSEKLITLGQIIAVGQIEGINEVKIFSDLKTLQSIQDRLESTYPVQPSERGLYRIDYKSQRLVNDLTDLGLTRNKLTQEVPRNDLWEGMKQTHCYREEDGFFTFTTESSKIARWVQDKFSTDILTKNWRLRNTRVLSFEYINVWKKINQ